MIRLAFPVLVLLLTTSCTHHTQPISIQKTEVVAKNEKIKKAVDSKSTYQVFGKRYHVMRSSHQYEEKGFASWYGRDFHRKKTSSGERFNMYKLTAAHKTLPLPTKVQVTNLKNGKKIVVTVNDRGPFISNRLIDLSYGAAKQLGMVGQGVAPVTVKALG
ncbi:MAG: septal ring lytic transglycosylase RlpA family protein [Gammaproteobacteria bacterium]|nr:septal ring lytic transglycosylase RlpA family protein [Gammaproteobacteria bacterium]